MLPALGFLSFSRRSTLPLVAVTNVPHPTPPRLTSPVPPARRAAWSIRSTPARTRRSPRPFSAAVLTQSAQLPPSPSRPGVQPASHPRPSLRLRRVLVPRHPASSHTGSSVHTTRRPAPRGQGVTSGRAHVLCRTLVSAFPKASKATRTLAGPRRGEVSECSAAQDTSCKLPYSRALVLARRVQFHRVTSGRARRRLPFGQDVRTVRVFRHCPVFLGCGWNQAQAQVRARVSSQLAASVPSVSLPRGCTNARHECAHKHARTHRVAQPPTSPPPLAPRRPSRPSSPPAAPRAPAVWECIPLPACLRLAGQSWTVLRWRECIARIARSARRHWPKPPAPVPRNAPAH